MGAFLIIMLGVFAGMSLIGSFNSETNDGSYGYALLSLIFSIGAILLYLRLV